MPALPLLLEVEQLNEMIKADNGLPPQTLLIDVSSPDNYLRGHIPGALHLPPGALQCGVPPAPGKLPDSTHLQQLFSVLGLRSDLHVIAYDDEGGGWAGRLLWTLEAVGHPGYSYLNGGIHAWRDAGFEVSTEVSKPRKEAFEFTLNRAPIAEAEDIMQQLGSPDFAIWDARSGEEHRGERVAAARSGHIPGAVNIDWLELIDRNNSTRLIDLGPLALRLQQLGLGPEKDIVTHCQSHHRSSLTWLVMKILNYPRVRGYHGSWGEWGNREDTPIEV